MLDARAGKKTLMSLENLPISLFDLLVLGVMLLSIIAAWLGGGVRTLLSLLAWVGAFAVALASYEWVRQTLQARFPGFADIAVDLASAALSFLVPLTGFKIAAAVLGRLAGEGLGRVDRWLGVLVGAARGALLVCLFYLGFTVVFGEESAPDWIRTAKTYPIVQRGTLALRGWLPEVDLAPNGETPARQTPTGGRSAESDPLDRLLESRRGSANL